MFLTNSGTARQGFVARIVHVAGFAQGSQERALPGASFPPMRLAQGAPAAGCRVQVPTVLLYEARMHRRSSAQPTRGDADTSQGCPSAACTMVLESVHRFVFGLQYVPSWQKFDSSQRGDCASAAQWAQFQ